MKNFQLFALLFIFTSCSLFKTAKLSRDITVAADNVCMNSEGKGRLIVKNSKYIFTYESVLDEEHAKWILNLDFPMRSVERFELDWSENGKMRFKSTIDAKILRENKEINPSELDQFVSSIGHFLKDIIKLREDKKPKTTFQWKLDKKSLSSMSKNTRAQMVFTHLNNENFFELMQMSYRGTGDQEFKMEFIVRKCFKNQGSDSDIM